MPGAWEAFQIVVEQDEQIGGGISPLEPHFREQRVLDFFAYFDVLYKLCNAREEVPFGSWSHNNKSLSNEDI